MTFVLHSVPLNGIHIAVHDGSQESYEVSKIVFEDLTQLMQVRIAQVIRALVITDPQACFCDPIPANLCRMWKPPQLYKVEPSEQLRIEAAHSFIVTVHHTGRIIPMDYETPNPRIKE